MKVFTSTVFESLCHCFPSIAFVSQQSVSQCFSDCRLGLKSVSPASHEMEGRPGRAGEEALGWFGGYHNTKMPCASA